MKQLILPEMFNGRELFQKPNLVLTELWRGGEKIDEDFTHNGIVTVGKNDLLDAAFRAQTQRTAWYVGLINNSGFSALSDSDTASSHAGWSEFVTFSQSTRPQWSPGAASAASITNSSAVTFDITGTATLYGMFVISNNTLSGTTGILWCTAAFSSTKSVVNGDQIKITYTLNC